MRKKYLYCLFCLLLLFISCKGNTNSVEGVSQFDAPPSGAKTAEISVEGYGIIYVRLFEEEAPVTTAEFIRLSEAGYYDNMPIRRIFQDYFLQVQGTGEDNFLPDEINQELFPFYGALCTANIGESGTSTDSFFIVQASPEFLKETEYLLQEGRGISFAMYLESYYQVKLSDRLMEEYMQYGGAPWLTGRHTVFGQVYDGFAVLQAVSGAQADTAGIPADEILIASIQIKNN